MANASLGPVYDRLNGVQRYHPFSAKTFADWSSEAGDTVRISREGTTYAVPVHKQSLVWRGKHMINMESSGAREREPIERVSNRKENSTSAGMSASRGFGGGAGRAIEGLQYDFYSEDGAYQSQLHMDEQRFTTIFTKTGIDNLKPGEMLSTMINQNAEAITLEAIRAKNGEAELSGRITVEKDRITQEVTRATAAEGTLSGKITVESNRITQEVTRATKEEGTLRGRITVEAGKISQIVSAVGENGQVTAASIVLAINQSTGQSEARINADHVYIGTSKSTTVINGKLEATDITADFLSPRIARIPTLTGIAASFSGNVSGSGGLFGAVYVGSGTSYTNISDPILAVQITGPTNNVYKLQYKSATQTSWTDAGSSFSRATTLAGTWGSGTFTVSATPQGNSISATLFDVTGQDVSWSGNMASFPVYANLNDGETKYLTGKTLSIDASTRYTAGYNEGRSDYRPDNIRTSGQNIYVVNAAGDDVGGPYSGSGIYNDGYSAGVSAGRSEFTYAWTGILYRYNPDHNSYDSQGSHTWYYK